MNSLLSSNKSRIRRESGFTLVELMVGLLLGVILLTATVNIFITTKQSYALKETMALVQENALFAFDSLRQVVNAADGVTATNNTGFTVTFAGRAGLTDCLGNAAVDSAKRYLNRFYVSNEQLFCEVTTNPASSTTTQALVNQVQSMQVEFGVDKTVDEVTKEEKPDGFIEEYLSTPGNYNQVLSVRVHLRLIVKPTPLVTEDVSFTVAMLPKILAAVDL